MFFYRSIPPIEETIGTLHFKRPLTGLGNYEDIKGRHWNVHAIIDQQVYACPVDRLHPYLNDTANRSGTYAQKWMAYDVEAFAQ